MIASLPKLGLYENLKIAYIVVLGIAAACLPATAQATAATETAASTFKANCAICHAEDGSGTVLGTRFHVKDLHSKEVQEKSATALAQTIRVGKDNMPAFGDRLTSEQIQNLIEYIRNLVRHPKQAASNGGA